MRLRLNVLALGAALLLLTQSVKAQTTTGPILGTVRDQSGATVANARVKVTNTDENTQRDVTTDAEGNFQVVNEKPAHYSVIVTQPGFTTTTATGLELAARQELRVDVLLQVGTAATTTTVEASAGIITTDTAAISSSYDSLKLLNIPANTRANGSTSPYVVIATLPGIQADNNNNFSIQGGLPSQSETSVDGISTTDVTGNQPLREAFPSIESIGEIRVEGVGNTAEFGQPGIVTTVSKSGTNAVRSSGFIRTVRWTPKLMVHSRSRRRLETTMAFQWAVQW